MLQWTGKVPGAEWMAKHESLEGRAISRDIVPGDWVFIAVALVLTAITFLGTLRFGFVYHDFEQLAENPFIKSWRYVPEYFHTSVWAHLYPQDPETYYRPLFLLWSLLNYSVFKVRPFGWHVTTLLLHLVVTFLVYQIVHRMTRRRNLAWLTALIFGVHPIHHETVAWVSGSTESLFAALFLASFLAFLHSREHRRALWMTVSCALYGLAMLAKETAVVLPALIFAYAWIDDGESSVAEASRRGARLRRAFTAAVAFLPVAGLYLILRYEVLGGLNFTQTRVSVYAWLLTVPSILFFYLRHWFFPAQYSEFYDLFYQSEPNVWHVILPGVVLLAIGILVWKFRGQLGSREVGFAGMWILIPLLPALDTVVFRPDELVHDRYLYVPSLGAALLVGLLVEPIGRAGVKVFGRPFRLVASGLALAVVLALCSVHASSFWVNDYALMTRAHQIAPKDLTVQNDLGVELLLRGKVDEAQAMFEQAGKEHPRDWAAAFNLGRAEYLKHDYAEAEKHLRRAIQLRPTAADPYVTLGQIQLKANRPGDALESMRRAVELSPFSPKFHTIYGVVLEVNGKCPAAVTEFEAALTLDPNDVFARRERERCRSVRNSSSGPGTSPVQN
jgi:tetratricopeptide (TPR) repeat protein